MQWIKERASALNAAWGPKRYTLAPLLGAVVAFADWVATKLGEGSMGALTGVPSWAIGVFATLSVAGWWLLEYAVQLRWQLKPIINIRFESHDPWIRPTEARTPKRDNPGVLVKTSATFIRIQVENIKPDTVAKSCLVYLTDVSRQSSEGSFVQIGYGDTMRLAWSARPSEGWFNPLDIPANTRIFADLLSVDAEHNKISVKWEQDLLAHQNLFDKPGVYKFDIQVTAENRVSAKESISVTWTGQWGEIQASIAGKEEQNRGR